MPLMMGLRRRSWANITLTLNQRFVWEEIEIKKRWILGVNNCYIEKFAGNCSKPDNILYYQELGK